jgi:hypothetical protein
MRRGRRSNKTPSPSPFPEYREGEPDGGRHNPPSSLYSGRRGLRGSGVCLLRAKVLKRTAKAKGAK